MDVSSLFFWPIELAEAKCCKSYGLANRSLGTMQECSRKVSLRRAIRLYVFEDLPNDKQLGRGRSI